MDPTLSADEKSLFALLPADGRGIGNRPLQRALNWDDVRYRTTVEALLAKKVVARGVGAGGSLKRAKEAGDDERLLAQVPANGDAIGNAELRRRLRWSEDKYFEVRNRLVDQGLLLKGPGRGGTVRRKADAAPGEEKLAKTDKGEVPKREKPVAKETSHYDGIAKVLSEIWSKERSFVWSKTEITAQQGKRDTGGKWSRPDLAVVSLKRYTYLPGTYLEVATFEVKTLQYLDVTAVYEALAHARAATRSYVLCVGAEADVENASEIIEAVREEASRHGIGLVLAEKASDFDTWDFVVEAAPQDIEHERLNDFIKTQCSSDLQGELLLQLRT